MIRGHFAADLGIEADVIQDGFVSRDRRIYGFIVVK
jgi:hypothetical protein